MKKFWDALMDWAEHLAEYRRRTAHWRGHY